MTFQQRDDSIPGVIYLLRAKNFHGILPGCYLSRMKIGLSRDLDNRLNALHSAQPCTDLEVVHTVYVENMEEVESYLHNFFKNSNVKLKKSREFFDLNPVQVQQCIWLMNRHDIKRQNAPIPMKAIAASLITLLGVGILIGQSFQPEPVNQTKVQRTIKHK